VSHYATIKTKLTDEEVLVQAIREMGYQVEQGKDIGLHDWLGNIRPQKADIVIRRKHLSSISNDIGFKKENDGFKVIISDMDVNRGERKNFVAELTQKYNYIKVKKEVIKQGLKIIGEKVHADKTIELVAVQQS